MVSLVNSHTNTTRIGWHLWEIDSRFAPGLPPGWHGLRGKAVSDLERAVKPLLLFAEKLGPQLAQPPLPLNRQRLNVLRFAGRRLMSSHAGWRRPGGPGVANALPCWEHRADRHDAPRNRADARRLVGSAAEPPLRPRHVTSASDTSRQLLLSTQGCHDSRSLASI